MNYFVFIKQRRSNSITESTENRFYIERAFHEGFRYILFSFQNTDLSLSPFGICVETKQQFHITWDECVCFHAWHTLNNIMWKLWNWAIRHCASVYFVYNEHTFHPVWKCYLSLCVFVWLNSAEAIESRNHAILWRNYQQAFEVWGRWNESPRWGDRC